MRQFVAMIPAVVAVILQSAAPARAVELLAGKWRGHYWYADATGAPKPFDATIEVRPPGNHFSGTISEPRLSLFGASGTISAHIQGTLGDDGSVRFVKTYEATAGMTHPVTYDGRLDAGPGTIRGTWTAEAGLSGYFEMTKLDGD